MERLDRLALLKTAAYLDELEVVRLTMVRCADADLQEPAPEGQVHPRD